MPSRNLGALLIVLAGSLALSSTTVSSTHQGPEDINAHDLNVLLYHPLPDHQGDPWGVAAFAVNGTSVDFMAGYYGGFDLPTAVIDGSTMIRGLPTVEGAGAFQDTYTAYRQRFEERLALQSPVSIFLDAIPDADALHVDATVRSVRPLDETGLILRFVLYEDDIGYAGGNGIVNHRFVVRALSPNHPLDLSTGEARIVGSLPVAPFIVPENVGIVAIVQNQNDTSPLFERKEVLQSATWTARQDGPTYQVVRGVLLELYSATWCASCVYGDSAADALADEFGLQSIRGAQSGFEYLRATDPVKLGIAAIAAIASIRLVRLRPPRGRSP